MTEGMNVKDYDYDLPEELIAQDPLEDRSSSRLMVLDRQTGDVEHRHFTDILEYLHPGDCLVINNTKVIPARLFGVKEDTQAKIEVLLLKRKEKDVYKRQRQVFARRRSMIHMPSFRSCTRDARRLSYMMVP